MEYSLIWFEEDNRIYQKSLPGVSNVLLASLKDMQKTWKIRIISRLVTAKVLYTTIAKNMHTSNIYLCAPGKLKTILHWKNLAMSGVSIRLKDM